MDSSSYPTAPCHHHENTPWLARWSKETGHVGEEPQQSPANISQPLTNLQTLEKIKDHCFQSLNLGMFCFTEFLWQEIYITEIMWARKQRASSTNPLSPECKFRISNERFTNYNRLDKYFLKMIYQVIALLIVTL